MAAIFCGRTWCVFPETSVYFRLRDDAVVRSRRHRALLPSDATRTELARAAEATAGGRRSRVAHRNLARENSRPQGHLGSASPACSSIPGNQRNQPNPTEPPLPAPPAADGIHDAGGHSGARGKLRGGSVQTPLPFPQATPGPCRPHRIASPGGLRKGAASSSSYLTNPINKWFPGAPPACMTSRPGGLPSTLGFGYSSITNSGKNQTPFLIGEDKKQRSNGD